MENTINWITSLTSSIGGGAIAAIITAIISNRKFKKLTAEKSSNESPWSLFFTRMWHYAHLIGLILALLASTFFITNDLYRSMIAVSLYIFILLSIPFTVRITKSLKSNIDRDKTKDQQKLPNPIVLSFIIISLIWSGISAHNKLVFWISYAACILPIVIAFSYYFLKTTARNDVYKIDPAMILPSLSILLIGATSGIVLSDLKGDFIFIALGLHVAALFYSIVLPFKIIDSIRGIFQKSISYFSMRKKLAYAAMIAVTLASLTYFFKNDLMIINDSSQSLSISSTRDEESPEKRVAAIYREIVELTDENFENEVLLSDIPVIVDFWAPWCGPCKAIGPIFMDLANSFGDQIKFAKCNVDNSPVTPGKFGIKAIPTLIFFKKGDVVEQITGMVAKDKVKSKLEKIISNSKDL